MIDLRVKPCFSEACKDCADGKPKTNQVEMDGQGLLAECRWYEEKE